MRLLTSYFAYCADPLLVVTHPTSSLAITDVRVSRLRPISPTPLSHRLHTTRVWLTWQHVLTLVPPVTFLGCSSSPHPYPRLPCPVPQHHQLRVKNERMTRSKPRSDVPRVRAHGSSFLQGYDSGSEGSLSPQRSKKNKKNRRSSAASRFQRIAVPLRHFQLFILATRGSDGNLFSKIAAALQHFWPFFKQAVRWWPQRVGTTAKSKESL